MLLPNRKPAPLDIFLASLDQIKETTPGILPETDRLPNATDIVLAFAPSADSADDSNDPSTSQKKIVSVTYDTTGLTQAKRIARELMIVRMLQNNYAMEYHQTGKMAVAGDPHRQCIFITRTSLPPLMQNKIETELRQRIASDISLEVVLVRTSK